MKNPFRRRTEERALSASNIPAVMLSSLPISVSPETAMRVNDVWSCVRLLSSTAATLPLIPYRRIEGKGRERLQGGRIATLLERPSENTTQAALIAQTLTHILLWGNAYWGLYRAEGEIEMIGLLAPDRITPEIRNGKPLYRYSQPQGEELMLTRDDVVHIRGLVSLDGLAGLSVIRQAAGVIGLGSQLATHATSLMTNEAVPQGVLKVQRFGDADAQIAAVRTAFETAHKGPENAGKIAVIAGEVDYAQLGLPPGDLQLLEQRKWSTVEISRAFGIPAHLVGAATNENLTYSNVEMEAAEFLKFSLAPHLTQIEQSISNHPALCTERQFVEFLTDALLRSDSATRAAVYEKALQNGYMTIEEVRERENLYPSRIPAAETPVSTPVASTNGAGDPDNVEVPS